VAAALALPHLLPGSQDRFSKCLALLFRLAQ